MLFFLLTADPRKSTWLLPAISALHSVDGRFEHFTSEGGITVIVDYAHTPDALQKCCETVKEIHPSGNLYILWL